jgi:anti-sigma28 factor (negative regulator of flagellin synthesis)
MNEDTDRMTKLADLRDRIRSGVYRIDPWQVADALLRRRGEDWLSPVPVP